MFSNSSYSSLSSQFFYMLVLYLQIPLISSIIDGKDSFELPNKMKRFRPAFPKLGNSLFHRISPTLQHYHIHKSVELSEVGAFICGLGRGR